MSVEILALVNCEPKMAKPLSEPLKYADVGLSAQFGVPSSSEPHPMCQ